MTDESKKVNPDPSIDAPIDTYLNPVFNRSFPDPFVLKYCGTYYAYATGFADDGLAIGVARSKDLVEWEYLGGALKPLAADPPFYWAPEVSYHNGRFYMYFSCGNEELMEIRVAVSDRPDSGFEDSGYRLTREDFAIDAHVFTDLDGGRYLFYATDFLGEPRIGTGTVVDRMLSWFELEGKPRTVTRAAYDWQVYDPNRIEKGGVKWHTVEGPTVFRFRDRYIEMFSGGNWKNESYGVAYASSREILSSEEWRQTIDGQTVAPVLRTLPGSVVGPGHNSSAIGLNGREVFCVYHSWVGDERVMAIDRMGFCDARVFVIGATYTPQAAPFPPSVSVEPFVIAPQGQKSITELTSAEFLCQFSFRSISSGRGRLEILLTSGASECVIDVGEGVIRAGGTPVLDLPASDRRTVFHELTIDASESGLRLKYDGMPASTKDISLPFIPTNISLRSISADTEVNGFFVTYGFEDLFGDEETSWRTEGDGTLEVISSGLQIVPEAGANLSIYRGAPFVNFEFVANIRAVDERAEFSFCFTTAAGRRIFELVGLNDAFGLVDNATGDHLALPDSYDLHELRQFRFVRIGQMLSVSLENDEIGVVNFGKSPATPCILTKGGRVEIELARWTAIG